MGYYITLSLGKRSFAWKYQVPPEISLLFLGEHRAHRPAALSDDAEDDTTAFVGFEATASQVRRSLDALGLTRSFFEAVYQEYRPTWVAFISSYLSAWREAIDELGDHGRRGRRAAARRRRGIDRIQRVVRGASASDEFDAAIEWLRRADRQELRSYGGEPKPFLPVCSLQAPIDFSDDCMISASVLGEFISDGEESLPEIINLLTIRLILEAMNSRARVRLDLRELVREEEGYDIDALIPSSVEDLASKVIWYQRAFDAIAGGNKEIQAEIARHSIAHSFRALQSAGISSYEKGRRLEQFLERVIQASIGLEVACKNVRTETQELDLVLKNNVAGTFWSSLNSPFIYVECKNWVGVVGIAEARIFESKMRQSGPYCRLGVFVALNGTTRPFRDHLAAIRRDGIGVAIITGKDFERLLRLPNADATRWLEDVLTTQLSHT